MAAGVSEAVGSGLDARFGGCHDPEMKRFSSMAVIAAVVAVTAAGVIVGARVVGGGETAPADASATTADGFPQGVFRYRLSKEDVLRVAPQIEPRYLEDAIGTFTWTLRDGVISLVQTDCDCSFTRVDGRYAIEGDRLTVYWPRRASNGVEFCASDCVETVKWAFDGKALRIDPLSERTYDVVFWGVDKPWRQIG